MQHPPEKRALLNINMKDHTNCFTLTQLIRSQHQLKDYLMQHFSNISNFEEILSSGLRNQIEFLVSKPKTVSYL